MSVANPGNINKRAAKAIAAPETISYRGSSFFTNCDIPDRNVLKPSYLAYQMPTIAVTNISKIVFNAPICEPTLMNKQISIRGIPIIRIIAVFICL